MPTKISAILLFSLSLCSTSDTVHADDGPPNYQYLKPIASFVGIWTTRFDPPGNVPEGELEIHFQWMGNKSYLQENVYFRPDGVPETKRMNPKFTVIGYSQADKATKAWHFDYENQGRTEAVIAKGRLVIHQQEGDEGGPDYREQTKSYALESNDTLVISETSKAAEGVATKSPPLRLTRRK